MALSIRERVHQALLTTLQAALGAASVERNREVPVELTRTPFVVLLDGAEVSDDMLAWGSRFVTATPSLEGYTGSTTQAATGTDSNALLAQVLTALCADPTLGGLAFDLRPGAMTPDILRAPGFPPGAAFTLELTVEYWTSQTDPTSQGPN